MIVDSAVRDKENKRENNNNWSSPFFLGSPVEMCIALATGVISSSLIISVSLQGRLAIFRRDWSRGGWAFSGWRRCQSLGGDSCGKFCAFFQRLFHRVMKRL